MQQEEEGLFFNPDLGVWVAEPYDPEEVCSNELAGYSEDYTTRPEE